MTNKLSIRNKPWLHHNTIEEKDNFLKWRRGYRHGKNRYLLRMLEETNQSFKCMLGNMTRSNIAKIELAHSRGEATCYHRPAVVKRQARLERYLRASYTGKL